MKNNIEFFTTVEFEKQFKKLKRKYKSLPDDLLKFQEDYSNNKQTGVDLGSNIRKVRLSIKSKGKGKSGGARIITYEILVNILFKNVILITIYDKSEIDSLPVNHIKDILERNGFK